jgi:hypothetical protein
MSGQYYEASLTNIFLAIARGEMPAKEPEPTQAPQLHWPVTCPNCLSEDTKPLDETHDQFECTVCGEIFHRS